MRVALLMLLSGCVAANAVSTAAFAAGVGAVRRASGDCFTICTPGTTCNRETGMCDPLPCGGKCAFDEKCLVLPTGDRCVPARQQ